MTTIGLVMRPLDVLFFRDGRPFAPGLQGASGKPTPRTLTGALRAALLDQAGCDFHKLRSAVADGMPFDEAVAKATQAAWIGRIRWRGPWFTRLGGGSGAGDVLVPAPATLRRPKKGSAGPVTRVDPLPDVKALPGWNPIAEGMRPLWSRTTAPAESPGGYLPLGAMKDFLEGKVPEGAAFREDELFDHDARTGIGVHVDRLTAEEGQIYGARFLALKPGVALYAEAVLPEGANAAALGAIEVLPLGGEGRHVEVETVDAVRWPGHGKDAGAGRALFVLTTPALLSSGWRPAVLGPEARLVAAAVPGAVAVSGWDMARGGPKPNVFAAAAGSVYFTEGGAPRPADDSLSDRPEDRLEGWGCFLKGAWNHA